MKNSEIAIQDMDSNRQIQNSCYLIGKIQTEQTSVMF